MKTRILKTEFDEYKFENVMEEDDCSVYEICKIYEKVGRNRYECIGETQAIDIENATDEELVAIIKELI